MHLVPSSYALMHLYVGALVDWHFGTSMYVISASVRRQCVGTSLDRYNLFGEALSIYIFIRDQYHDHLTRHC